MGWGDIHLISLLSCVFVAATVVGRAPRCPTVGQALGAVVAGLLLGFVALVLSMHMCHNGVPVAQWALPAAGVAGVLAFARPSLSRALTIAGLACAAFALSQHYSSLVHEPGYIGHADAFGYEAVQITPFWHSPLTGIYAKTPLRPGETTGRDEEP